VLRLANGPLYAMLADAVERNNYCIFGFLIWFFGFWLD
jgi:hypothetical protein